MSDGSRVGGERGVLFWDGVGVVLFLCCSMYV